MKSYYKIYFVTNLVNGKQYVGQTVRTVWRRWLQHRSQSRKGSPLHFHRSISKYGKDSFKIEWIASCFSKEDANYLEEFWIRELKTYLPEHGYNSTFGGEGARHTEETKAKLSTAKLGKPGHKKTPEEKKAASERQKGSKNTMFGRSGIKSPAFGRTHTPKALILMSLKGKERTGAKNPMFGRHHSQEAKDKISAFWQRRRAEKILVKSA